MALKDDDIKTTRLKSRRSFLGRVGATVGGAVAAIAVATPAKAKDAKDFIARDNKGGTKRDKDQRSGDAA